MHGSLNIIIIENNYYSIFLSLLLLLNIIIDLNIIIIVLRMRWASLLISFISLHNLKKEKCIAEVYEYILPISVQYSHIPPYVAVSIDLRHKIEL